MAARQSFSAGRLGDSSVLCGEAFHDQGHDADQVAHGTHDGDVQGRGLRSRIVDRDEVDVRSQRNAGRTNTAKLLIRQTLAATSSTSLTTAGSLLPGELAQSQAHPARPR